MKTIKILSSEVSFVSKETLDVLVSQCRNYKEEYVIVTNTQNQFLAYKDDLFSKVHENAFFRISDSVILKYLALFLGEKNLPEVKLGSKLMLDICEKASNLNLNIGLLGDTEDNLIKLRRNLEQKFTKIHIPYSYSPPFRELTDKENSRIIDEINLANVDILFVSLGCPKQERWMYYHSHRISSLSFGVGAAFTFIAKPETEVPTFFHKVGLGWFIRFLSNPKKFFIRYFVHGLSFIILVLIDKFKTKLKA